MPRSADSNAPRKNDAGALSTRVPPHNAEAERGVLGSILLDSSRVMDLCIEAGLTPEAFYEPSHTLLFEALAAMARTATAIDAVTVVERLKAASLFDRVGGAPFLERLIELTPTAAHAEYYIDIVRQKALLRRIIDASRISEQACYEGAGSADLILAQAEQTFLGLGSQQSDGLSWSGAMSNTVAHIDRIIDGTGVRGLPTGFSNLDHKLHGLRNGEMIVLAARPSQGKTSLAMNIAECVMLGQDIYGRRMKGEHNRPHAVMMFSVEMSQESLALRMLCGFAGVPFFQIESGLISANSVTQQIKKAAVPLSKAPLFVDDTGGIDVMEMRARARRMKKKHNVELVIIDYLQLLNHREFAKQGRQIETSQISANVKAMAKELNVPVIVLSQLSRGPEQRGDKTARPKCSDLRDSGAIEQDADVILLLRRPCKYPGDPEFDDFRLAIVDVAKHRNGPTGEVRLDFDDRLTRFSDRTDREGSQPDEAQLHPENASPP